jgi:hypothetical protein
MNKLHYLPIFYSSSSIDLKLLIIYSIMNDVKLIQAKIKTTPSGLLKENLRKDCYGNIISKKSKKHKICFPDKLDTNNKIAEILNVDSYKYNKSK